MEAGVNGLANWKTMAIGSLVAASHVLTGCGAPESARSGQSGTMTGEGTGMEDIAEERLVAIDVLLEPDRTMLDAAEGWNARLREQMPEGFALDAAHRPHITLLQQYVREQDLDEVLAAVDAIESSVDLGAMQLTADGLYHIPSGAIGLQGITIEPAPPLLALQDRIVQALAPYRRSGGDQSAFVPDPSGAAFDPFLFSYVDDFAQDQTGANYNPHVTTGTAPVAWVEAREAEPFDEFRFGVTDLSVYKLGNFGTAAERLGNEPAAERNR